MFANYKFHRHAVLFSIAAMVATTQSNGNDSLAKAESIVNGSQSISVSGLSVDFPLKKADSDLAGTTWIVQSSDGQKDRWKFGNGSVDYQNLSVAADRGTGSWSIAGERLTIRTGYASWQGTLSGNRIQGNASNPTQTIKWNWTAERQ
jgi:hypothetical protein